MWKAPEAVRRSLSVGVMLALAGCATGPVQDPDDPGAAHEALVHAIERQGIDDPEVLAAMRAVPRHEFVPEELRPYAYEDRPLPIGLGQTISQPYVVALMTDLLECGSDDRVLEIGTGSGYQAAVLAELGCEVYTIEIIPELGERAAAVLDRLGYRVSARIGDGYPGWPEAAPFDGVIVTAAPEAIPDPLIQQLAVEGRMVIPVGPRGGVQELVVLSRRSDGTLEERSVIPVRFVPLVRPRGVQ